MDYDRVVVTPGQLFLDPNNYRFHDLQGYSAVKNRSRYQEPGVQQQALKLLRETTAFDFGSLKDSIRTNGYIPIEQIVVIHYDDDEQGNKRYLVIEGNRRTACLKTLLEDSQMAAVDLANEVKESIEQISVVELKGTQEEIKILQTDVDGDPTCCRYPRMGSLSTGQACRRNVRGRPS